jgi:UDP-GlcNAc3NAcA epimerase
MIEKIEEILVTEHPDWVMVYGDTNSTLAGAIAASKLDIKIAHIEAGLRSFNMRMPEEVNRILTDRISSVLFCPTQTSVNNLNNEGIKNWKTDPKVFLVGDVMLDAALYYKKLAQPSECIDVTRDFLLCTIHPAENTDDPVRLNQIMGNPPDKDIENIVLELLNGWKKNLLVDK